MAKRDLAQVIREIPTGTTAARLRQLMPEIERRLSNREITHQQIVEQLNKEGEFGITLATFRTNLQRYRAQKRKTGKTPGAGYATAPAATGFRESADGNSPDTSENAGEPQTLDDVLNAQRRGDSGQEYLIRKPNPLRRSDRK